MKGLVVIWIIDWKRWMEFVKKVWYGNRIYENFGFLKVLKKIWGRRLGVWLWLKNIG